MQQITMQTTSLESITDKIKERETLITINFLEIGKALKHIRNKQIYKEKHKEFGEYINKSNFSFSERHAYTLISIAENFSEIDCTKLGITKCAELLRLSEEQRQQFKTTHDIMSMSVRELKEAINKQLGTTGEITITKQIETLDRTLSSLSNKLDIIFQSMGEISNDDFKIEFMKNKEYYTTKYKDIDVRLRDVTNKLKKAKSILISLRKA